MCIDTVSLPNVSRYDDISMYRCISNVCMYVCMYVCVCVCVCMYVFITFQKCQQ